MTPSPTTAALSPSLDRSPHARNRTLGVLPAHADPSPPEPPQPFAPDWEREDGRGLALVRACADVWGWQPLTRDGNRGKYVWCELGAA